MTSIRNFAAIRILVAVVFVVSAGVFGTSAEAATRTWDGGAGGTGTDMSTGANWSGDALPVSGDTAEWNGTVGGNLSLNWTGSNFAGAAGNVGYLLSLTSGQTGSVLIDAGNTNSFRLQSISIAAGAGAFTFGDGTGAVALTLANGGGLTRTFTNNSSNLATLGSDLVINSGSNAIIELLFSGSGNWLANGNLSSGNNNNDNRITKTGTGTLTLAGANTFDGGANTGLTVTAGTLNLTGNLGNTAINLNPASGTVAVMTSSGAVTRTSGQATNIGSVTGGVGVLNVTTGGWSGGSGAISAGTAGHGVINVSGGSISPGQFLVAGITNSGATGVWNVTGGSIQTSNNNGGTLGATAGTTGVLNMFGSGSYSSTGTTASGVSGIFVGESGAGVLNVAGTGTLALGGVSTSAGLDIGRVNTATASGIVNLGAVGSGGGTITTNIVRKSGSAATGIFNFHGGTLNAAFGIANSTFMNGLTNAYVYGEGGTLNNNGQNITIGQSLLAPTGNGLSSISLGGTTTGYTPGATPLVTISGGGGTGATAIANVDGSGNLTTTITNPGTGYTSAPTVTFTGTAGLVPTATASIGANVSGGLNFDGSGTTTLTGANSFGGTSSINAGTVAFTTSQSNIGALSVADFATLSVKHTTGTVSTLGTTSLSLGSSGTPQLDFDFSSLTNPSAALISTGALTANSSPNVTFQNAASLVSGTYPLISYTSFAGSGTFPAGAYNFTPRTSGTIVNNGTNAVNLVVTADKPVWTGADSAEWKVGSTGANSNWKLQNGGTATDYIEGDAVVFNDSATGTTSVDISANFVSPANVTFGNSTKTYTISSTGGFGITGTGGLIKNGNGVVNLTTANSFSGGTTMNAGTLNLEAATALGSGATTMTGGTLNVNNATGLGTGPLTITGGVLDNTSGGAITVTADNPQNWNGDVVFTGSNNLDMGKGAVTLGGTGASRTVTVNAGTFTVGAIVGLSQGLTKAGPGILAINPLSTVVNSSIAGTLNVASGTLQINTGADAATTMDFIATGLAGSGTIRNGGGFERWLFINTTGNDTFSGTLENGGTGALGLNKLGSGTLTLAGPSTYTGATTLTQGTLVAASPTALGNTFRLNVPANSNVTFRYATDGAVADNTVPIGMGTGTTVLNVISDRATPGAAVDRTMSVATGNGLGGGTVNFTSGANVTSGIPKITFTQFGLGAGSNQTTVLNPVGVNLSLGDTSKFNNNQPQTLELGGTSTLNEITGVISNGAATGANTVSVTKSNTGTWKLSNANTFTGTTTLIDGTLIAAHTSALGGTARLNAANTTGTGNPMFIYATDGGDTTVPIGLSTGSAFTIVSDRATPGAAVDRTMTVPSAVGGLGNGTINFTSGANVTSGTPRISFNEFGLGAGSGGTTTLNPVGVNISLGNVAKFNNNPNQTLALGGTSTGNEITGVISNILPSGTNTAVVSVTKTNTSTWTLTGNSTYSGTTAVNGGTLLVTGNNSGATGAVTIAAAGTLGGTGTLGALVTNNGTIAPGTTGIGTLTVAGLTLSTGSTLSLDLGAPSTGDLINITATNGLTLNGGGVVVNNAGGLNVGTYPILDYGGTLGGALANLGTPTGPGGFSYSLQDDGSFINLVVAAAANNGDWNGDTKVNAADYVTWRKNPAAFGNDPGGYVTWRENFSTTSGSGSGLGGAAVPEPATFALVGLAVGMMLFSRRGR